MVQISLAEMFSSLGWGSGFKLPVSNEVNARLERELEQKQRKALQLSTELEENTHYVDLINNQIERVEEQIEIEQKVAIAKRSEVDTEVSLKAISIRTLSKAEEDCKRLQKQVKEINTRNVAVSNDLRKRQALIDELVGIVEFDKTALERYKETIEEKENYIAFVEQFAEMDSKSVDECKKKYDKLASVNTDMGLELTSAYQSTVALQTQLDQNTSLLRRINQERVEALDMWKATLSSMKSRDKEISEIAKVYAGVRSKASKVEERIIFKQKMLESEQQETNQRMRIRNQHDRNYCSLKERFNEMLEGTRHMYEMQSKVKGEIKICSHDAKTAKKKIASLEEEIKASEMKLQNLEEEVARLKGRQEIVMGATMTSEERMKEIESLMDNELDNTEHLRARVEREGKFLWHRNVQKTELRNKLEQLEFGIRTSVSHIAVLKEEMIKQEIIMQRKQVLLYQVELEAFQLNSRCMKLLDPIANINSEEIIETQTQINFLKEEERKVENKWNHLVQEVKHIDQTVKNILKQVRLATKDNQCLRGDVLQGRMENEKCAAENKTKDKVIKDETVEYSLLQVQLKRITDLVQAQRKILFDLEHDRLLTNSVTKERKAEIDVHLSLLAQKKRLLQDDRSKIKIEIAELQSTLEKLKIKHDILMRTLESGSSDEVHSPAYIIIKRAEETELLKQEGDLWDARVKEAEQEVIAIQNTLSLIFNSNNSFKDSLAPIVESSADSVEIKKLQEDSEMAIVSKKHSNKERAHLSLKADFLEEEIKRVVCEIAQGNVECYDRKYELSAMRLDLENQNTKIRRANVMSNKILRELGPQSEHERNFIELDMKYLATKTKLEYALSTMERFIGMFPAVKCSVVEYLHLKDMKKAAARIMSIGKSGSSSVASTPNRSGRTTPMTGKSLTQKMKSTLIHSKPVTETSSKTQVKKNGTEIQKDDEKVNLEQDHVTRTTSPLSDALLTDQMKGTDLQDENQMSGEKIEIASDLSEEVGIRNLDLPEDIEFTDLPDELAASTNEAAGNENETETVVLLEKPSFREVKSDLDEQLKDLDSNAEQTRRKSK